MLWHLVSRSSRHLGPWLKQLVIAMLLSAAIVLLAPESIAGTDIYEPIYTIRQNGMGGVYVFDDNDATSFQHNPAYSCMTKGINWSVFDINAGINGLQIYNDITAYQNLNGLSSFSALYGKKIWTGFGGHSVLTMPCFGFALYDTVIATFLTHNPAFPNLEVTYQNDMGYKIGGGINFGPNFAFGMDIKRLTRKGGSAPIGTASMTTLTGATLADSFSNQGDGYGLDAGIVYRNESAIGNPTLSLAWRDVGSVAFVKSSGTDAPDRQRDNAVLGLTVNGSLPLLGFAAGLEYRHMNEPGIQIGKKLHLGVEASLLFFDFRAGFYQGYTTYGASFDLWLLRFDAATYAVERGAYAGQTKDERIQIGMTLDLSFDPNFNLTQAGGKRRKLKQRR